MPIYHIIPRGDWEAAQAAGQYAPESLEREGFIHTSTRELVVETANRYYLGQHGLVLLVIDADRVQAEVRHEPVTRDGRPLVFPHIYGPLNLDAVVRVLPFEPGPEGPFTFPPDGNG